MASIKDIAKELGVSVSTVSLALNDKPRVSEEMRQKIKEKAREMNYVKNGIAADLQRKRTNIILFIVNDASRSFFSSIINHLQVATAAFGYDFLICTTYGDHIATAKRFLEERRADAAIVYTSTVPDEMIREYAREDFPIVVLGRHVEGDYIYSNTPAQIDGALLTVDYMIEQGLRRVAFVKGSRVSLNTSRSYNQYRNSLEKYGIAYDDALVFDAGGASYKYGYSVTEQLLPIIHDIDAIQYSSDDIAIGGMMCLREHGVSVPDDISVAGRNNIPESGFIYPGLTTLGSEHDDYLFYESIIHYLIVLIEKDEGYENISAQLKNYLDHYSNPAHLIVRGSVKTK